MIVKLVELFNCDKDEDIACAKLDGGDFMLEKGLKKEQPTIENTLESLYLIACRKK